MDKKISILSKIVFEGEFKLLPALKRQEWTPGQALVIKHAEEYMMTYRTCSGVELLKILLQAVLYDEMD